MILLLSDAVTIALIATIAPTIASVGALLISLQSKKQSITNTHKIDVLHNEVDGKMTQLLETTKISSKAEGKLEGKDELIEVLKQTPPLEPPHPKDEKPIDVIIKNENPVDVKIKGEEK